MTAGLFEGIATRFKALAEPARLRILDALRDGELTVGDLAERTALNQANLSKHLQLLHGLDFVVRRKDGLFVYYALKDHGVFQLCDLMCGRIGIRSVTKGRRAPASPGRRTSPPRRTAAGA